MGKRGRKTCPKCDTETGARTHLCDCGYHFPSKEMRKDLLEEKKNSVNKIEKNKIYETKGKGRKKCPSCNIIIGGILKNCFKCNFDFIAAKKEKNEQEEKERQEKRAIRAEKKRIKEEEKQKNKEEKRAKRTGTKEEGITHPEVKKLMNDEELLEKMADITMNGPTYFTPDEHADRILSSLGINRITNLLNQHKNGNKWVHVNWKKVEEGLKEKV